MNNKSDKKHKPKHKKKTPSQSKKKKEIKNGGAFSFSGLFSGKKKETSSNEHELPHLQHLLPPHRPNSNNTASSASNNSQQPPPELPNIKPNATPSGFNTLKAQSRCSIM